MTPEQNQAAWIAYELAMDRWKRAAGEQRPKITGIR